MFTLEQIRGLNELEQAIYNYVTIHRKAILHMKIRDLADEVHVSTTTILRFCKKVDCEGFSEFKLKYAMFLEKEQAPQEENDVHMMLDFFHKIDNDEFDRKINTVAKMVYNAEKVVFLGIGTSGILAKYGARYFANVNVSANHIDDPFYPISKGYDENTLVFVFSVSGETQETIKHVSSLKGKKCKLISVCNRDACTIAKLCDLNLSYYMPMDILTFEINITTQIPVIYMIETIGRKVHRMKLEEA